LELSGHAHALYPGEHGRQRRHEAGRGIKLKKSLPGSFQSADSMNSSQNYAQNAAESLAEEIQSIVYQP
jgi:hypothetical protein